MSVTVFTAFQPKLKGVCPKGVSPTPSDFFAACQEPKHCNLQCLCLWHGMEEIYLATC